MNARHPISEQSRLFVSGNEAVSLAARDAKVKVAAAYPGTPSTEILEYIAAYPDIYSEWSINEKVSLEVAIGASLAGSRALCAMKHVGLNVASDALMTQTLIGAIGGLVVVVADDVGLSSSQNEQDSRYWGRFAHIPVLEPADTQEAYDFTRLAFDLSEQYQTPVLVRLTTRICHVKGMLETRFPAAPTAKQGFLKDPARFVMVPGHAKNRIPLMMQRDAVLLSAAEASDLNVVEQGSDELGFIVSGVAYQHVKEAYPEASVLKLGFSHPAPLEKIRAFSQNIKRLILVEEVEPLLEKELKAEGIALEGKSILPNIGELTPVVLKAAIEGHAAEVKTPPTQLIHTTQVFPRPPTMCVACPHLGVYYTLSKVRNTYISGDIGCYTLGAGHPWNALDTCISMGASMGVALGLDKGRQDADSNKKVISVIGDSTFLHMGMQGLLDLTYNKANVTVLLLDNRAVGMTGGQNAPSSGINLQGEKTISVDFPQLVKALGVKEERVHVVDPYELPTLFKTLRDETKVDDVSVIITNQPCVLTERYHAMQPLKVEDSDCNGCGNCLEVGCPAILVSRRETVVKPNGSEKELAFVNIDTAACTGCNLCVGTCGPKAIVPAQTIISGYAADHLGVEIKS
ncbi:indolepyruvate ferredoxin oxidoreductase alpha subunit [Oceanospirillum multiglobuliferum]|uniref:Indolepyruvate oxidoreductase subunit IorA n=1 Tax=Oceanospirillum multiglobuliferum TaxID=64969 RepID=A0A1T4PSC2_9GAMM|nr:thiamine pyrophosphate-dependent enzyme [Oceanospirillum multiglobuliferum]OPX55338.1 indolepyruvate ferredoxin oxidoreductase [Oceanospirillum multiglobuliferum]SJZ94462.1 indolepyruvate ferredoxin oxidoreductase alpha subunit [Oceanospirillum multiglobuliferum]